MPYDPHRHHRRSVRLPGYEYTSGAYAVTICTHARRPIFGCVADSAVGRSEAGEIAHEELLRTPAIRPYVAVDAFVVMPDHIHAILVLSADAGDDSRSGGEDQRPRVAPRSLGSVVQGYKAAVVRRLMGLGLATPPVWQRGYYESVLRTERHLAAMRRYIEDNPRRAEGRE